MAFLLSGYVYVTLIRVDILLVCVSEATYSDVGYVESSAFRVAVINGLTEGPRMPSELSEATNHDIAHMSRALGELAERDIVELLVDEEVKKGRIYGLSEKGENTKEMMDQR